MSPTGTKPASPPSAPAPGSSAPEPGSLDSQIDALLSGPAPTNTTDAEARKDSASEAAEAAVASIEKQVETLVDQFVEPEQSGSNASAPSGDARTPAQSAQQPAVATTETIEALDDQLARLTDELLASPPTEPVASAAKPQSASTETNSAAEPPAESVSTPTTPIFSPLPGPAPTSSQTHSPPTAQSPTHAPSQPQGQVETPETAEAPTAATPAKSPGKLVAVLAGPLAGKPRMIRDTIGWLGFNSLFLAGVVWGYHLWFQKPEKPVAHKAPASLISGEHGATSSEHNAHADGPSPGSAHAEVADPHGVDPHASNPNAKEHRHDEHADASHASDEPITGVQPLHKKKPTYALSDAMAEKLNVAKKAETGHGGEKKSSSGHGAPPKSGH
ncbi:MAG: hypothetical protein KF691_16110 [Phycisphaeraceae bacterium]|nr:hypothetical protein [Phycisphaeraceae bacterium]